MAYFTKDYHQFFKDLAANNNRDWFHENKKRYEQSVKKPFAEYIQALIDALNKAEGGFDVAPKDCIMRINRDIRFSKDKTPYNLHCSGVVAPGGKKDHGNPGVYIRFTPETSIIMGGRYMLEKEELYALREKIASQPKALSKLLSAKKFSSLYSGMEGEKIKRIPKEFKEAHEAEPLIANKQFYFKAEHKPGYILSDDLVEKTMEHWRAAKPVTSFLFNL